MNSMPLDSMTTVEWNGGAFRLVTDGPDNANVVSLTPEAFAVLQKFVESKIASTNGCASND